jgi:hypothetical protein
VSPGVSAVSLDMVVSLVNSKESICLVILLFDILFPWGVGSAFGTVRTGRNDSGCF